MAWALRLLEETVKMANNGKSGRGGRREGAGGPVKPVDARPIPVTIKLHPTTVAALKEGAGRLNMSQAQLVTHALKAFLERPAGPALERAAAPLPAASGAPTQAQPTQAKPTQAQPTQEQPTQAQPTQAQPTQAQPTQEQPTQAQPTRAQPTQAQSHVAQHSQPIAPPQA
jgi:hypothetical protein